MKSNDSYEIGCIGLFFVILAVVDFQYAVLCGMWITAIIALIWCLDVFFKGLDWWDKIKNTKTFSLVESILLVLSVIFFIGFFLYFK